jgi:hypothetical protein
LTRFKNTDGLFARYPDSRTAMPVSLSSQSYGIEEAFAFFPRSYAEGVCGPLADAHYSGIMN